MNNNNGFSMIELLTAIAILGILSVLAIGSVQLLLDKSEEEYYKEQENSLSLAAQSYYQNNTHELPKSIGQIKEVKLSKLISSKYIEQIKSKNKNNCKTYESCRNSKCDCETRSRCSAAGCQTIKECWHY